MAEVLLERLPVQGGSEQEDPQGECSVTKRKGLTVAQAVDQWFDGPWGKTLRRSTRRTYRSAIEAHVRKDFAKVRLERLDEETMLDFINTKLDAGLSVHHLRTVTGIIQRAASVICRRDRIALPPVGQVGALLTAAAGARETEVPEPQWWSQEEIAVILELAGPDWFGAFVRVAADTGMRRGEIMGLQVADLDFSGSEIRVRRAIVDDRQVSTKTRQARSVVMAPGLATVLRRHLEPSHFALGGRPQWLFSGSGEGHIRLQDFRSPWDRLRRRFSARGVRPHKFHAFRHSWATHAIANGEPIPWVSAQLGHSTAAFTLRQYAHAEPRRESNLEWLQRSAGSSCSSQATGEAPQPARSSQMANPMLSSTSATTFAS